jgi:hypothetical protein
VCQIIPNTPAAVEGFFSTHFIRSD